MAAGSAGSGAAIPMTGDLEDIPNMRAIMSRMQDSITTLFGSSATLYERTDLFNSRVPDIGRPLDPADEHGPAVRERPYSRRVAADDLRIKVLEDALSQSHMKVENLEQTLAFYFNEVTAGKEKMEEGHPFTQASKTCYACHRLEEAPG